MLLFEGYHLAGVRPVRRRQCCFLRRKFAHCSSLPLFMLKLGPEP